MGAEKKNRRQIGGEYELRAIRFLTEQGYELLERNYYTPFGEIDAIFQKNGVLIFVEIKYRSSGRCGDPIEAVGKSKQRRISKSAMYYYTYHGASQGRACRFDVVGIYGDERIVHIENAFEYQG